MEEDPIEILRRRSWTAWKALALQRNPPGDPDLISSKLHLAEARVAMQRAPRYLDWLRRLCLAKPPDLEALVSEPIAELAYQLLWNKPAGLIGVESLIEAFQRIQLNETFMTDLQEVVKWATLRANTIVAQIQGVPETLELHGLYSGAEINAAFGKATIMGGGSRGTGVVTFHDQKVIVHLVTFEKTVRQFSESTMYRDFPTRPDLLHWESQSVTTQDGKLGKLYAAHESTGYKILFFSRIRKEAAIGLTSPFLFLGCGKFIDATGNRPIAIRWHLEHPMPQAHFREARVVCGLEP